MINLSIQQLRKAATLKERIQSLEKELGKLLGASTQSTVQAVPKKKRKMSRAGKAKIVAAQKARWAKVKGKSKPVKKARKKMSAAAKAKISAAMKARWAARIAAKK